MNLYDHSVLSVSRIVVATATAVAVATLGFVAGRQSDRIDSRGAATQTVTREMLTPPPKGDGTTLSGALFARARPPEADLVGTWWLSDRPRLRLIYWHLSSGAPNWGTNVLAIWGETHRGWSRVYERRRPGWIRFNIQTGDLTQDFVEDVVVTEPNTGTALCGARLVISIQNSRSYELFRRHYCERLPHIVDDMLVIAEPIGDCPFRQGAAHCYGGLRTQVLAWQGRKRVIDRTFLRCFGALSSERLCRRPA